MKTCCSLHPMCYCRKLTDEDEDEVYFLRKRPIRPASHPTLAQETETRYDRRRLESLARRQAVRQRSFWMTTIALVLALIVVAATLVGCKPTSGPSPAPEPSTSEMYTVIRAGGIFDNN